MVLYSTETVCHMEPIVNATNKEKKITIKIK